MELNNEATTITTNVEAAAPIVVEPKAPSKMELARPIFKEVTAEGVVLPEGKTARATFIARAVAEISLTEKGAATYYQNLTKEAKGLPLYSRKKKVTEAELPEAEVQTAQAADDALDAAIANAQTEVVAEAEEQAVA